MAKSPKSTPEANASGPKLIDPRERFAKPPFPKQQQPAPRQFPRSKTARRLRRNHVHRIRTSPGPGRPHHRGR